MDERMTSPKAMKEMAERLRDCADDRAVQEFAPYTAQACEEAAAMLEAAANTLQTPVDSDVLVKALEFYADEKNWTRNTILDTESSRFDGWSIARAALAQKDKVKP